MNQYATHQPVLCEAVLRTAGTVVELGCGDGSTDILHKLCDGRNLITIESDREWFDRFAGYDSRGHEMRFTTDWTNAIDILASSGDRYSVVFVDQAPWEARYDSIESLRGLTDYIVLHDCDYFPDHGMLGKSFRGIISPVDIGVREYNFKFWKEFFPLPPWPYPFTGPPTLLASDFLDCNWVIDGMMEGCRGA